MKDTVKAVVDKYGMSKIRYGLIVFGTTPITSKNFGENFPTSEDMKNYLNLVRRPSGKPDLVMALDEAKRLFDRATNRPNARKVLALIMDDKSVNKPEDLKRASKELDDKQIQVVSIAVGKDADPKEMEHISSHKEHIVEVKKDEKPKTLAEKIMDKVMKGKSVNVVFNLNHI